MYADSRHDELLVNEPSDQRVRLASVPHDANGQMEAIIPSAVAVGAAPRHNHGQCLLSSASRTKYALNRGQIESPPAQVA